jgi:COP9 signalosome complex subunit 6
MLLANETPLFLLIDADAIHASQISAKVTREIPIHLFESIVRVVEGEPQVQFSRANFSIATRESERISVDQVARAQSGSASTMATHIGSLSGSIRMLNERLKLLQKFVAATQKGEVEPDLALMRRIHSLVTQLPAAETTEFRQDLSQEYSDALLTTYLAALTKSAATLSDTVDKFNVSNDNARGRRGGFHEMM